MKFQDHGSKAENSLKFKYGECMESTLIQLNYVSIYQTLCNLNKQKCEEIIFLMQLIETKKKTANKVGYPNEYLGRF